MIKNSIPVLLTVLWLMGPDLSWGQGWPDQVRLADSLKAERAYDSALTVIQVALVEMEQLFAKDDTIMASMAYRKGACLFGLSRLAEAEDEFARALDIRQVKLPADHPDIGKTFNALGYVYTYMGEYNKAESLSVQAVELVSNSLGPEHPQVAFTLDNLVSVYLTLAKYIKAEEALKRVLEIRVKEFGPGSKEVALAEARLGDTYQMQGKYGDSRPLLERSLSTLETQEQPDLMSVALVATSLAAVHTQCGEYDLAGPLLQKALAIWEAAQSPLMETGLYNAGHNYYQLGDYAQAEPLMVLSLEIAEQLRGEDHSDLIHNLNGLAQLYQAMGRSDEAEAAMLRVLDISGSAFLPDHPSCIMVRTNLAFFYTELGRYDEAAGLFRGCLEAQIASDNASPRQLADAFEGLALISTAQERYGEAISLLDSAIAITETSFKTETWALAAYLVGQGDVYRKQGEVANAKQSLERAITINRQVLGPQHPRTARGVEMLSKTYRLNSEYQEALALAKEAFEIRRKNFIENSTVLSEADALKYSSLMRQAADNYLSAFCEATSVSGADTAQCSDAMIAAKGQVSDGVFERQRTLVSEASPLTRALTDSLRRVRYALSNRYVSGADEDPQGYTAELDSLSDLAGKIESELSRHSASYRQKRDVDSVSTDRVRELLPPGYALIEFLKYKSLALNPDTSAPHYIALVIDAAASVHVEDLGPAAPIDTTVSEYRRHMLKISLKETPPSIDDRSEYGTITRVLYEQVWQPIQDHLAGAQQLLVAPDGALNLVSFAGLPLADGRYLIEEYPIQMLTAARDLVRLQHQSSPGTGLLAIGDPDFDATAESRLSGPTPATNPASLYPEISKLRDARSGCEALAELMVTRLPGTRREIRNLEASWKLSWDEDVTALVGVEATEDALKHEVAGKRVVHLATHGYYAAGECIDSDAGILFADKTSFAGDNPLLFSGLLLAGSNLHGEGCEEEALNDGVLTAQEVCAMDLSGCQLVVLSACESGLGTVQEGEGVYGLRRAFQIAGARTVISSLWPVSDNATADMMKELYRQTATSFPKRLQQIAVKSIKKLRKRGQPDHPVDWAAFICIGDWRALK